MTEEQSYLYGTEGDSLTEFMVCNQIFISWLFGTAQCELQ